MTQPLVSVIMPTYNHAPFVVEAIESVLAQEGVALELLIEDDGSSDGTADAVRSVQDPRISFRAKERNEGAGVTVNGLISRARGEFVALINSDDVWLGRDKLARQVELLQSRPEVAATFGRAEFIDGAGQRIPMDQAYPGRIFEQENRPRAQWLRHFFLYGNCLCHPTILIRRSVYQQLGMYDNRLRQLPDFDLWIRVAKHHELHVDERALTRFRLLGDANASAQTPANSIRITNEHYFIFDGFFVGMPPQLFLEGFGDLLLNRDARTREEIEVEQALLYLRGEPGQRSTYRMLGMRKVFDLLASPGHRAVLANYSIDDLWLQRELAAYSPFVAPPPAARPAPAPTAPPQPPAAPPPVRAGRKSPLLRYLSFLRK